MNKFTQTTSYLPLFILLYLAIPPPIYAAEFTDANEIYQGEGFDPEHLIYGTDSTENIDPFTGSLTIVNTDLVLPGNGGLDLTINRVLPQATVLWRIGFGSIKKVTGVNMVTIELQDGSVHYAYQVTAGGEEYRTKDFWKVIYPSSVSENNPPYLFMSDGTKMVFGKNSSGSGSLKYLATAIVHNTNTITIDYTTTNALYGDLGAGARISQVTDSTGRKVLFKNEKVGTSGLDRITEISYCPDFTSSCANTNRKKIQYKYATFPNAADPMLKEVIFPAGGPWVYNYLHNGTANWIKSVMNPSGGITEYTFDRFTKNIKGSLGLSFRSFYGVTKKKMYGRNIINPVSQTFAYTQGADDFDYTTITDDTGRSTTSKYYGYNRNYNGSDDCWLAGTVQEITTRDQYGQIEQIVQTDWDKAPTPISTAIQHKIAGLCTDSEGTFIPRKVEDRIIRDGKKYTTSYEAFDLHENPTVIYEVGDVERLTQISYWKNGARNIFQGKPESITKSSDDFPGKTVNIQYEYNEFGQTTKTTVNGVVTQQGYDGNQNIAWTTDANGNRKDFTWSHGRISQIKNQLYPTKPVISTINPDGTVKSVTNGREFITNFHYDNIMRLTLVEPPANAQNPSTPTSYSYPRTTYTFNGTGYLVDTGMTQTRRNTFTKTLVDGFNRQTRTENHLGIITSVFYNGSGFKESTDSNVGDLTFFDRHGRPTEVRHKDGTSTAYDYAKSDVLSYDESDILTRYQYSAFGTPDDKLLTKVIDAMGNTTTYQYNISGLLENVVFNDEQQGSFQYDDRHYLVSATYPETGTTTYTRYSQGNIDHLTDGLGLKDHGYDVLNRLKTILYGSDSINFTYDAESNLITRTNPGAAETYTYDPLNRLTEKSETIAGRTYMTKYAYDELDNICKITYPSGREVIYKYNALGQVAEIPGYIKNISYFTQGLHTSLIESITYENGVRTTLAYNKRNRLEKSSTPGIHDKTYQYNDPHGNLTEIIDNIDAANTQPLTYDDLYRLRTFSGPWGAGSYTYYPNGNRKTKSIAGVVDTYLYGSENRLAYVNGKSRGYNSDGDLTSYTTLTSTFGLSYDPLHNLSSFDKKGDILATFAYNAENRRVLKYDHKADYKVIYHYDQLGNIISEDNGNGTIIADYVHLNNNLIAKLENSSTGRVLDRDNDGLIEDVELSLGTNPDTADSDNDGSNDGQEYSYWGNNWDSDADADGTINLLDKDSDDDGLTDGVEIQNGSDPTTPSYNDDYIALHDITINSNSNFNANIQISAENVLIDNSANVEFTSNGSVVLLPGFHVEEGSHFKATTH